MLGTTEHYSEICNWDTSLDPPYFYFIVKVQFKVSNGTS